MLSANDQKFDRLSGIYDFLVSLVFGKSLRKAQCHFLSELPEEGSALIMGGGSGWILEEISQRKPKLEITYVEASKKMLERAQKRTFVNPISFVHGNEQMIPGEETFDALITPFFLDLFDPVRLLATMSLLDQALSRKGLWLFTDFYVPTEGWTKHFSRFLIYVMYRFFRMLCRIDARRLPDFDQAFQIAKYEEKDTCYFYSGIIRTMTLRKKS